jgi:hypothetical protein
MSTERPTLTFGIIVLNGEPFMRYNLRNLYPFAHEIIVVEGASVGAKTNATRDGHSTDETLETLKRFQSGEDPDHKIQIVTAEDEGHPDGFWPGEKEEQSRAYARRATGDYLWQVDVDEFYHPDHIQRILDLLRSAPTITQISFRERVFWGSPDYCVDGFFLRTGWPATMIHRIFRWGPGYAYTSHRPVSVVDAAGRSLIEQHWITSKESRRLGVFMYHYSLLFPKQVREKCLYYRTADWCQEEFHSKWETDVYNGLRRPFRVEPTPGQLSWLERFQGEHPPLVTAMMKDIRSGRIQVALRDTADIRRVEGSASYRLFRRYLKCILAFDGLAIRARSGLRKSARRIESKWFDGAG